MYDEHTVGLSSAQQGENGEGLHHDDKGKTDLRVRKMGAYYRFFALDATAPRQTICPFYRYP